MSSALGVLRALRIDPYVLALVLTAATAALLPVRGPVADDVDIGIRIAISGLFFVYGTRLSARTAWDGMRNWRLHTIILLSTFAVFPVLGLTCRALVPAVLPESLFIGVLLLCALPSTVQSSIALTSLAKGNVAAAICSASVSNVLGVVLTPVLLGMLARTEGGISAESLGEILLLLLVPFLLGLALHPWLSGWLQRHRTVLGWADRGVILAVVYSAFSKGAVSGVWQQVTPLLLALLVLLAAVLLTTALGLLHLNARWCGLTREDRIVAVFCGAQKSLASGLPMATVLFGDERVSLIVLPLMLYHQLQLIVCAWLARRFARTETTSVASESDTSRAGARSSKT